MIVAGNWKMHKLTGEAREFVTSLKAKLNGFDSPLQVVLCPPFTALSEVASAIAGTNILLGAQNVYWEEQGAFTGEISPLMLKDLRCTHVIIGHSERREYFGETDETVNKKVLAALKAQLTPIVCVGESEQQRDEGKTEAIITGQVRNGFASLTAQQMAGVTVAYEPVWAIGTGKTATPDQAQEVHALIRQLAGKSFTKEIASSMPILYGGSVKPENADELLDQPDINGALVGGASLEPDAFEKIVRSGANAIDK